ncbi:MAG: NAD(P)-binding domain-containing protein [Bacteroidetes bacterium]|nr:NAD(P)-binding domain-containing protein [Bacteroidota bacterium]
MKKIGILGSGVVAKTLGSGFIKHGYEVMLGTGNPEKLADWQTQSGGKTGSFAEVAAFGEVLVLAVKGAYAQSALQLAGLHNLTGKTILDATNPIDEKSAPEKGVLHFFTDLRTSLMEQLQSAVPEAHFVKAFNSVGSAFMVDPQFAGGQPTMFICGNHDRAKQEATAILQELGWEVEDMGAAEAARAIEPLCILWCIPGFLRNQWSHAFKLLKA